MDETGRDEAEVTWTDLLAPLSDEEIRERGEASTPSRLEIPAPGGYPEAR